MLRGRNSLFALQNHLIEEMRQPHVSLAPGTNEDRAESACEKQISMRLPSLAEFWQSFGTRGQQSANLDQRQSIWGAESWLQERLSPTFGRHLGRFALAKMKLSGARVASKCSAMFG